MTSPDCDRVDDQEALAVDTEVITSGEPEEPAPEVAQQLSAILESCYAEAARLVEQGDCSAVEAAMGAELAGKVAALSVLRHASRGALLTLLIYKVYSAEQDIRYTKDELPGGFSARSYDTKVTVPLLMRESLPYNVETHWLSQTLSFAPAWTRDLSLKTVPKAAGPLLIDCVNCVEEWAPESPGDAEDVVTLARAAATLVLVKLIEERNQGKVSLTKPKNLTIAQTTKLLSDHFGKSYTKAGAARLPQLAMYAIYQCILESMLRYDACELEPLARMKSADRKSGTVGDVVVTRSGIPVEAVETKLGKPVDEGQVRTAIDKIRTGTVDRYFILSTAGVNQDDRDIIDRLCREFRSSNGCEIIVNGVLHTIAYYLRLIESTGEFVIRYVQLLEDDSDLDYEHKVAWNVICADYSGPTT